MFDTFEAPSMTPTSPFPSRGPSACAGPWRGLHVLHTHGEERRKEGRGCVNKSSSVCVYSATEGARVVLRRLGGGGALQVCVRGIWSLTHIGAVVEVYILASAPFVHRCRTLLYMGYRCKACRSRSSHDQLVQHCARARSPQEGISTSLWRILDPRKTREIPVSTLLLLARIAGSVPVIHQINQSVGEKTYGASPTILTIHPFLYTYRRVH